jgi:hypothetical protein
LRLKSEFYEPRIGGVFAGSRLADKSVIRQSKPFDFDNAPHAHAIHFSAAELQISAQFPRGGIGDLDGLSAASFNYATRPNSKLLTTEHTRRPRRIPSAPDNAFRAAVHAIRHVIHPFGYDDASGQREAA